MKRAWYNNGVKEILVADGENIPDSFIRGRLPCRESCLDVIAKKYPRDIIYNLYIIENESFINLAKRLDITESQLRGLLTRYDIKKNYSLRARNNAYRRTKEEIRSVAEKSSATQKAKWKSKTEEEILAYREMQRAAHSTDSFRTRIKEINIEYRKRIKEISPEVEEDRNRRRSKSCKETWNDPSLVEKRNETTKQRRAERRGMLCRTLAEQKMYSVLVELFPDLQYDVKVDTRYPFFCDFYIPSTDTFIELNAHPSHGTLPVHMLPPSAYTDYSKEWLDTLTRRDVEKLETAQMHSLNYIMIYPRATLEENFRVNDGADKCLVEVCYSSQKIKFPS